RPAQHTRGAPRGGLRLVDAPQPLQDRRKILETDADIRVRWSERTTEDRQRLPEQRRGRGRLPPADQDGEIVQGEADFGMRRAERLGVEVDRRPVERLCLGEPMARVYSRSASSYFFCCSSNAARAVRSAATS